MTRPTKERIANIRRTHDWATPHETWAPDLLAEIDYLRAELDGIRELWAEDNEELAGIITQILGDE